MQRSTPRSAVFCNALLVRQFGVPAEDAEMLVFEAFISFYTRNLPFREARTWLIGEACDSASLWRAKHGLPPGNEAEIARTADKRLSYSEAAATLPERARKALRLRFDEKMDYPEIAAELDVSTFMAKRYVKTGVAKLRAVLRGGPRQP